MVRLLVLLALLCAAPAVCWAQVLAQPSPCDDVSDATALAACNAAIETARPGGGPALARLLDGRGRYELTAGRDDAAVADFTFALAADRKDTMALEGRGQAHAHQGRRALAMSDFSAVLALVPGDMNARLELAEVGSAPIAAGAGSLSAALSRDPDAIYVAMKGEFAGLYSPPAAGQGVELDNECAAGTDYLGAADLAQPAAAGAGFAAYADLALRVVRWKADLTQAGYPRAVWATSIERFEQAQLPLIAAHAKAPPAKAPAGAEDPFLASQRDAARAFEQSLKRALDAYRETHPNAPHADIMGACGGGGGGSVAVTTQPAGAVVMFIPVFFYKLCQAEGIDPDDPTKCDRWREMLAGVVSAVAGDYDYVARWPDGAIRRGALSFDAIRASSLVLSKP